MAGVFLTDRKRLTQMMEAKIQRADEFLYGVLYRSQHCVCDRLHTVASPKKAMKIVLISVVCG